MNTMSPFAAILRRFVSGQGVGWVAVLAIVLSAAPASAQALADEGWALQGGPYLGSSIEGRDILPEFGARLGASRGTQLLDLTVSAYQVQFNLPRVRQWSFEALAGMAWQRRSIGLGFRSGIVRTPNFSGERSTAFILWAPYGRCSAAESVLRAAR